MIASGEGKHVRLTLKSLELLCEIGVGATLIKLVRRAKDTAQNTLTRSAIETIRKTTDFLTMTYLLCGLGRKRDVSAVVKL